MRGGGIANTKPKADVSGGYNNQTKIKIIENGTRKIGNFLYLGYDLDLF